MTRYEAHIGKDWEEIGVANLVVARIKADGGTDVAHFLVDAYCLGVKDALVATGLTQEDYHALLAQAFADNPRESIHPACAKKLVEGAAAYAESLGFSPHRDYRKARRVFSGVDAAACPRDFTYGLDGRPHFIPGPDDSETRIDRVLTILENRFGPDGFGFEDDEGDDDDGESARRFLIDWFLDEPADGPDFYTFAGLVGALVLCPSEAKPLKVLDALWGPEKRTWQDAAELQNFMDLLMPYWNHVNDLVLDAISPGAPAEAPSFDVWAEDFEEDEAPLLMTAMRNWCSGFVLGVEQWPREDAARLNEPALAPHWEVVRVFARYEAPGHAARIDAMTKETPPRRLGSSITVLARGLRQPVW